MKNKMPAEKLHDWLVALQDVSISHEGAPLFEKFSAHINPGCVHLVSGPNGVGKSTLLKHLASPFFQTQKHSTAGLGQRSGNITYTQKPMKIEYLSQLQNTHCFLPMTINDSLEWVRGSPDNSEFISEMILDSGLVDKGMLNRAWNSASGGERMRALLGRALLRNPQLLLLDEPLNHLDVAGRNSLENVLVRYLNRFTDAAVVLVSHQHALHRNLWDERLHSWNLIQATSHVF